jgi:ADP-dependent NAD(P)H-hydrate dehydratase
MMEDKTDQPLPQLPVRAAESHKGDYGRVFMVGGSRGMAGAIGLAGMAALRSGAGLVTLMVPQSIQATVASYEPSVMTLGVRACVAGEVDEDSLGSENADAIRSAASQATVVALGPGLGRAAKTVRLIHSLYHQVQQTLVVDADGLNGLAEQPALLKSPSGPRVLTPHPGEFARLMGEQVAKNTNGRVEQAARLCSQVCRRPRTSSDQTIVVLKGYQTVICDGLQYAINSTGNPGMATGGTGDCLTGILAALIGQGLSPWEATRLGVYLHGRAGDLVAEALGQVSMIASDLIQYLPQAFKEL